MNVDRQQSVFGTLTTDGNHLHVTRKNFRGFSHGTNKADEYSWFYFLALTGNKNETIEVTANLNTSQERLTRNNSLVFSSTDGWHWEQLKQPVWTDHAGLKQRYTFTFPTAGNIYLSNTIFFDLRRLRRRIHTFASQHQDICTIKKIGTSLLGCDLEVITFEPKRQSQGRILVTTGCHPAEPDVIGSLSILDYLATPESQSLRDRYTIDVMPIQNPDGFQIKSCLTANGVNLYWNFRRRDRTNCPEAYYLWQYIQQHPPLLYLDFHAYVHQYHRQPMPYLKPPQEYTGHRTKRIVASMDRFLKITSRGYYRFGQLATWPRALSYYITKEFNTIAYTKYHFNLYEGIPASRQRAQTIFNGLTDVLLRHRVDSGTVLTKPHGSASADASDAAPALAYYQSSQFVQHAYMYAKSYYRYYRYRNSTGLYKRPESNAR